MLFFFSENLILFEWGNADAYNKAKTALSPVQRCREVLVKDAIIELTTAALRSNSMELFEVLQRLSGQVVEGQAEASLRVNYYLIYNLFLYFTIFFYY